jgi:hypothetical protein
MLIRYAAGAFGMSDPDILLGYISELRRTTWLDVGLPKLLRSASVQSDCVTSPRPRSRSDRLIIAVLWLSAFCAIGAELLDSSHAKEAQKSMPLGPSYREFLDLTSVIVIGRVEETKVVQLDRDDRRALPPSPRPAPRRERGDAGEIIEPLGAHHAASAIRADLVEPRNKLFVLRGMVRVGHAFLDDDAPAEGSLLDVNLGYAAWPLAMEDFQRSQDGRTLREGKVLVFHLAEMHKGRDADAKPETRPVTKPATRPATRPASPLYELVQPAWVLPDERVESEPRRIELRLARYHWLKRVDRVLAKHGVLDGAALAALSKLAEDDALRVLRLPTEHRDPIAGLRAAAKTSAADDASKAWRRWRADIEGRFILQAGD